MEFRLLTDAQQFELESQSQQLQFQFQQLEMTGAGKTGSRLGSDL